MLHYLLFINIRRFIRKFTESTGTINGGYHWIFTETWYKDALCLLAAIQCTFVTVRWCTFLAVYKRYMDITMPINLQVVIKIKLLLARGHSPVMWNGQIPGNLLGITTYSSWTWTFYTSPYRLSLQISRFPPSTDLVQHSTYSREGPYW